MTVPYYTDDKVTLYLGDMREVLPELGRPGVGIEPDCCVTDPPYGETSLLWDVWPDGWLPLVADVTRSMWCFGSMRMYLRHGSEFDRYWNLSQDVVWRKQNGTGFAADRFRRVHEHVLHWYRGAWNLIHHDTPRTHVGIKERDRSIKQGAGHARHMGKIGDQGAWVDDGTRLIPSVLEVPNMWRRGAIAPTEKPVALLDPLIRYACPPVVSVLECIDCGRERGPRVPVVRATDSTGQAGPQEVLQQRLQERVPASDAGDDLPDLWTPVPRPQPHGATVPADMLAGVRSASGASEAKVLRGVRGDVSTTGELDQVLLPSLRDSDDRPRQAEAIAANASRLRDALPAGSPDGDQGGLRLRASTGDGRGAGTSAPDGRGGASPQRDQGRQPAREPEGLTETGARSHPQAVAEADPVPALPRHDRRLGSCPNCGGPLALSERPGLVLDPFAGSCSTLVAAREAGYKAIGIEADEAMAEKAALRLAAAPLDLWSPA
ncbi:MAG TPA: DNA methyltransferase [Acidimicrobiales bacterium]|nr:DNA methyltransferase [Acidimicrobiales bacterium]